MKFFWEKDRDIKIFAHRGFSGKYPENTKIAFEACKNLDIYGIETDVQYTKDKVVVIVHDENLKRLTKQNVNVKDLTYDEFSKLKVLDSDQGFITLEEYVSIMKDSSLVTNVELKTSKYEYLGIEKDVIDIFKARNMLDRLVISRFNHDSLLRVKEIDDKIKVGALQSSKIISPEKYLSERKIDFYHPYYHIINKKDVKKLHSNGIGVNVRTINKQRAFKHMNDIGVDGIITNYPDLDFPG